MNALLIRGVAVGALAGLLFGFDTAVIAGTTEGIRAPSRSMRRGWASPCPARCGARWPERCWRGAG
jgi:hypothetical protein